MLGISEFLHIVDVAKHGRSKSARTRAYNQLIKLLTREVGRANQRMRSLEKNGYDYGQAYDNAAVYLKSVGRKRFSANFKPEKIDALYLEYARVSSFLNSGESTISGRKKIDKQRSQTFREKSEVFRNMSDTELSDFQRFLGNESVETYLAFYQDSEEQVEMFADIIDDETKRDKLVDLFNEYQEFLNDRKEHPHKHASELRGLSFTEVRTEIDKLYESIGKRRR